MGGRFLTTSASGHRLAATKTMIYSRDNAGTQPDLVRRRFEYTTACSAVGVIAPQGVLFRGGAEGRIRKALIEENLLEAVIGLPDKLFFGTGIAAVILLFKRGRKTRDVMFIDASGGFVEGTNQNRLGEEHIKKIVATYRAFETVPKYAYRATPEEIAENDYNLNIPRYVDTFEPEKDVDLKAVQKQISDLEQELASVRKQMAEYLKDLNLA